MTSIKIETEVGPDHTVTLTLPPEIPPGRISITVESTAEVTPPLTKYEQAIMQERASYLKLHSRLVDEYLNQYVAIHDGNLIDSDRDRVAIWRRVQARYPDKPVYITRVQPEASSPLYSVSTRLLQENT